MLWLRKRRRAVTPRTAKEVAHYQKHKEAAREHVRARLEHFNEHYQFTYHRVAIKNQRRCWGSCSAKKNLNFHYKVLFLPPHLADYIIVHELCHVAELNHKKKFWKLVSEQIPNYQLYIRELRTLDRAGYHKLLM